MAHPATGQQLGQALGVLHAGRAGQDGPAHLVVVDDLLDYGVELGLFGFVDEVVVVVADHGAMGGDRYHLQAVGVGQLRSLGLGRSGHAGQLVVHAEVVLQGDGGQGLVLLFDPHPLLGLHRLVDALGPAPAFQGAAGVLVNDLHLTALHDVVLVPVKQLLGLEGHLELMDQVGLHRVVEVLDFQDLFDPVDAGLGGGDGALCLFHLVVHVASQLAHNAGEALVKIGRVGHPPRDDEGGSGLVDQDGVDLVDDGVAVAALDFLLDRHGHVVAQVVEAKLVVGAVGDVAGVLLPLEGRFVVPGHDEADGETQPAVDLAHPLGVATGQVVVDGDDVDPVPTQPVEINGQGGHQRFAFTGAHLRHPAEVQSGPAHDLHVVVALPDDPMGRLAGDRERLEQNVIQGGVALEPFAELDGLVTQILVGQLQKLWFQRGNVWYQPLKGPKHLAFTGAEDTIENAHAAHKPTGATGTLPAIVGPRPQDRGSGLVDETELAVLPAIEHCGPARSGVGEEIEAVSDQVHLQHRVVHGDRPDSEGLFLDHQFTGAGHEGVVGHGVVGILIIVVFDGQRGAGHAVGLVAPAQAGGGLAPQLGLEPVQLLFQLVHGHVNGGEAVGRGDLAAHHVALALQRHLTGLPFGNAGVAVLVEVDLGVGHAVQEPFQSADLVHRGRSQGLGNLGMTAADADLHNDLVFCPATSQPAPRRAYRCSRYPRC